jgi:GntR family transcriptional regulator/MocR family aminotransferase
MEEPRPRDVVSLFPDHASPVPLSRQLVQRLRHAIRSGSLAEGSRLLPTREFASRLGVSRNTVVAAVDQLIAEGYLVARVGSGTFVARGIGASAPPREIPARALPRPAQRFLDVSGSFPDLGPKLLPFRTGVPDVAMFPREPWDRFARRLRYHPHRFSYGEPVGLRRLRTVLADHLQQFRGVTASPEQIVIVEGAQAAIALIASVLIDPGERVLLEDPSYGFARMVFEARGAEIVPSRIDENGLNASDAPAAKLAFVTPSHQYPLGGTMPPERRTALLEWASRNDAYVIEDDYDGEFRFGGPPLPALQNGDADGRVVYVGTFSKVLAPGLRIGYIVAPPHLAPAFADARAISSLGADPQTQRILADFIAEGYLARHVRRLTGEYQRRAELLTKLLEPLAGRLQAGPATGGIHVTVAGDESLDDRAVSRRGLEHDVLLHPLSVDCIARTDLRGFALGFGAAPLDVIPDAVARFRAVLEARE